MFLAILLEALADSLWGVCPAHGSYVGLYPVGCGWLKCCLVKNQMCKEWPGCKNNASGPLSYVIESHRVSPIVHWKSSTLRQALRRSKTIYSLYLSNLISIVADGTFWDRFDEPAKDRYIV